MTLREESILVLSNSNWNISNFRKSFISSLRGLNRVYVGSFRGQERISIEGVEFIELPNLKRNSLSMIGPILYLRRLITVVNKSHISRIYVFTFYLSVLSIILKFFPVGKRVHVRVIITGLGKLFTSTNKLLNILFYTGVFLLRKADSIVVQNNSDLQLLSRFVSPDKIDLVPGSGVSLLDTEIEPTPKEEMHPMYFCYVGRLLKSKGVDIIVEAFRKHMEQYPNDKLLIVGDYDSNDKNFKLIIKEKNIEPLGWFNDVGKIFAKCHATILMSDREGMPKTLLESLANSTPIIAFGAPGVEDIYRNAGSSEIGVVVQERNAESLFRSLQVFRKLDKEKYIEMGRNGRKLVSQVFKDQIINKELK